MRIPVILAASLFPAPVFAGGVVQPTAPAPYLPPAPAVDTDWTGAYGGLSLEYGTGDLGVSDFNGPLIGVFGGYRYDLGNYVVGAEIDYVLSDIAIGGEVTIESIFRAGVEAGADLGRTLVYGTAGYAQASLEPEPGILIAVGTDFTPEGYFLGIGADHMISDNLLIGAEVLWHDLGNVSPNVDLNVTTVAVNLTYRF